MSSIGSTLGSVSSLPKKITDVTEAIAKGGGTLDNTMTKLGNAINVSGTGKIRNASATVKNWGQNASRNLQPLADAAKKAKKCLDDLTNCREVATSSALVVNAIMDSCTGHLHPRANEKVLEQFSAQWDSWAAVVNKSFEKLSPSGQSNVLEQLGMNMFGPNVFYMGSAIKNNSSGIFGGIADFEDSVHAFRGSYRNPVEAVKKIEKGVKGIVAATEKVANSINGMIKTYQNGMSGNTNSVGSKILTSLGSLHDTKAVSALSKTLTIGGGAATLFTDGSSLMGAVKSKDPKAIITAGQKAVKDTKEIVKELKNNGNSLNSTSLSQGTANGQGTSTASQTNQGNQSQQSKQSEDEDDGKDTNVGKSDSYVCSGATMRCTKGTKHARLTVLPSRTVFLTGQPMANISDHLTMINLAPFGKCRSLGFPATASATAAHHGHLTPMPCMHNTPFPWQRGKDDYIVKGDCALLKSSICPCMWGGTISLVTDGQKDTGSADLSKLVTETFEKNQEKEKVKDEQQDFSSGIMTGGAAPIQGAADFTGGKQQSAQGGSLIDKVKSKIEKKQEERWKNAEDVIINGVGYIA